MTQQGILFIISAPSGAGKTTLCKEVVDILPNLRHS
ncbi:MAG: guanylate kinase, partial [Geobacteraceae bacterium]